MDVRRFQQLAARFLRHPIAPYFEHTVRAEAEAFCAEQGLKCSRDRFGNLLVRVPGRSLGRPIAFAAHMDHPGFRVLKNAPSGQLRVEFRGSVGDNYFKPGLRLLLMPGRVRAKLGRRLHKKRRILQVEPEIPLRSVPDFGVWDLEDCAFRNGRIYARGCDDIVGVAAVLATLAELKRRRANVRAIGILSRAEEVGFHGALALAAESAADPGRRRSSVLPRETLVISLETSRELPGATMGQGVVLRVGDRASIFDSDGSRFLAETAANLAARNPRFRFQRALMSGGTCEATAYQEFGFQSAAVCVPLGNYHNCATHDRIRAEYVSVTDVCGMVDLLVHAAVLMPQYSRLVKKLPARLNRLLREARANLLRHQ